MCSTPSSRYAKLWPNLQFWKHGRRCGEWLGAWQFVSDTTCWTCACLKLCTKTTTSPKCQCTLSSNIFFWYLLFLCVMPPLTTLSAVLYINIWCIAVLLDAPDTVLIERANGKRIDPETGGIVLLLLFALVKCCGVYAAGVIILFVLIECLPPDFQLFKKCKIISIMLGTVLLNTANHCMERPQDFPPPRKNLGLYIHLYPPHNRLMNWQGGLWV